jgi:ketosteroid isomerase-like protein
MTVPQKDGSQRQDKGKYLTVWKRQANGEWKIVADTWSSDLTPP